MAENTMSGCTGSCHSCGSSCDTQTGERMCITMWIMWISLINVENTRKMRGDKMFITFLQLIPANPKHQCLSERNRKNCKKRSCMQLQYSFLINCGTVI